MAVTPIFKQWIEPLKDLGVTILLYILVAAIISVPYVMRQRSLASTPA